jgi:hypothetical protein
MWALKIIAAAGFAPAPPGSGPYYVMAYDPDSNDGRGEVTTTTDIFKALAFEKSYEAWEKWKQQSRVRPLRSDGRPNRPLTAFTVTVEEVPHPARQPVSPGNRG